MWWFVVRGGGPASELTVFNHPVANVIVNSQCPVVIAVGHSADSTLPISLPRYQCPPQLQRQGGYSITTKQQRPPPADHRQRDAELLAQSQLEASAQQSADGQHAFQEATQLAALR
jgi:Exonuclease VII, large subunit